MRGVKESLLLEDLHPVVAGPMVEVMAVGLSRLAGLELGASVGQTWGLFAATALGGGLGQWGRLTAGRDHGGD